MATNKRVAKRQHRWLSSVETTGVVLSEPVLADAGNFRSLDKAELANFRKQREIWNLPKGMVEGDGQPAWINFILDDFLGIKDTDYWQVGASIPSNMVVTLPEQQETLRPSRILLDEGQPIMLLLEVPREQSLDKSWLQGKGRWKASPTTKFDRLLRETGIELGLLTNGEAWRLVVASPSETTSWMTWTAQTWNDDPLTLAAFKDLFGESRFFAGPRDQVVLELIKQSRQRQLDVADQLGNQVREALQILVHELDRADAELGGSFLQGYGEAEIFESSVAFIMRLLFTLYAEENGLLPHGNVNYDRAYGILHLLTELEETKRLAPEKLKHSYAAYARLLASSRLLHDGSVDPDIRIAAHGGQLFDPNRYLLLDGRTNEGTWPTEIPEPPKIRDAAIRDILRSLKYARADGVRQLVSYRTLAVEQIGHMYEGLLDRRVARAPVNKTLLLLQGGSKIKEPEPVDATVFSGMDQGALIKTITKHTSKTAGTVKKVLERDEEHHTLANLGTDDAELLEQANPVIRFVKDLGIVRPSGLYVCQGQDRRSSGAHYTPPTLTEPVVRHTLEHQVYVNVKGKPGLLQEPRLIKIPQEILNLKVCDPAMGSGAFLVQATRYLAERLVDAWERIAAEQPDAILTMPFATQSQGEATENMMPESREERIVFARRYVAERCIYGVDMNRLAVEMAKLSLWLATLSTDRPFTFVDHALKHGNSLIGLSPEQIRNFTWKPVTNDFGPLFENVPEHQIEEAEKHREAIHDIPDHDFIRKEQESHIADAALVCHRQKATLAVAAFFNGANNNQRETNLVSYRYWLDRLGLDDKALVEIDKIVKELTTGEKPIIPFCWEVEFPEVFYRNTGGFDAVVGNPPFVGGKKISTHFGKIYADYVAQIKTEKGAADLCTYFVLRASDNLIRSGGSLGFIATNSISEGATREVGLRHLIKNGSKIFTANKSIKWPGHASVFVSIVHLIKGDWFGALTLNENSVNYISTFLDQVKCEDTPPSVKSPVSCFSGVYLYGEGFVLDEKQKNELVDINSSKLIRPYLVGEDVNNNGTGEPSRWAIDFGDMNEDDAKRYEAIYKHLERLVKPVRTKATGQIHEPRFWIHWDRRTESFEELKDANRIFVKAIVSNYHIVTEAEREWILSKEVAVYGASGFCDHAVLQSNIHELWARRFSTTMKNDMRYSISSGFSNFRFPEYNDETRYNLENAGLNFHTLRKNYCISEGKTLRQAHSDINNPQASSKDIDKLRYAFSELEYSVLNAYDWNDIDLGIDFNEAVWLPEPETRYTISATARAEILQRLLT
ncbi:MAG: hypothetical protein N0E58_19330 [Candidatus Thiodiazotropha endolucinida]|uniref:site-specific DNA-methyltransferase (adenine-specific) n=1 Tax=Candidatus Thiodiazotropha taylori TaxID=2792791 RepID=A0A9E4NMM8_9GAMM|nr:hypothetical protein [Candidatus Thiodiazotropha taylori]MCW4238404.1 hypothetical protein [Candidatus Thiodiazotropha endolucinida]